MESLEEELIINLSILRTRELCFREWDDFRKVQACAVLNSVPLESDVLPFTNPDPEITTELRWESDRLAFHRLRSQKVTLRVTFIALNDDETKTRQLGHLVLDLREAIPVHGSEDEIERVIEKRAFWKRLLGPKRNDDGRPPEVLLCLTLEPNLNEMNLDEVSTTQQFVEPRQFEPILNENGGFFEIGSSNCNETYYFRFGIVAASNLQLAVLKDLLIAEENAFYFSYELMGVTISTETFRDLHSPKFTVEEAVVKIKCSLEDLISYMSQSLTEFKIQICSGIVIFCSATVNVLSLLGGVEKIKEIKSGESKKKSVSYNGIVNLSSLQRHSVAASEDPKPMIGVSVSVELVTDEDSLPPDISSVKQSRPGGGNNIDDVHSPAKRPYLDTTPDLVARQKILAAVRIEEWKKKQEETFKQKLQKFEEHHLNALSKEWLKRDKEWEDIFQSRLKKIEKVKAELSNEFAEAKSASQKDQKDKQIEELTRKNKELNRRKLELEKEIARLKEELKKYGSQVKSNRELIGENKVLTQRNLELEKKIARLKEEIKNSEFRLKYNQALEEKQLYKKAWEDNRKMLKDAQEKIVNLRTEVGVLRQIQSSGNESSSSSSSEATSEAVTNLSEILRLEKERELVRRTGVYSDKDDILAAIDSEIKELKQKNMLKLL